MFKPNYQITPQTAAFLMRLEGLKQEIDDLPININVLAGLRESARLQSTHYSTKIEGNRLTQEEVQLVIFENQQFPGRERDAIEVLGYYLALSWVEKVARKTDFVLNEEVIKTIHSIVMGGGKKRLKPTPYRDGQNVIREGGTNRIIYLPPEAKDIPELMSDLIKWINNSIKENFPVPLIAAIAHYQFATIHPYYDGNGRTARLLVTLLLHAYGFGLKGIYSLEEYYAKNLNGYYQALTVGPHNYYMGRAEGDITGWVYYFCSGMVYSFEQVRAQALKSKAAGCVDDSKMLRNLDAYQRTILILFKDQDTISAKDIEKMLSIKPRTARLWCQKWVATGFLGIANKAKKNRKYFLKDFNIR